MFGDVTYKTEVTPCPFKEGPGKKCGGNVYGSAQYCYKHTMSRCACGSKATHNCYESYKCEETLCDGQYCTAEHNIKSGHTKSFGLGK